MKTDENLSVPLTVTKILSKKFKWAYPDDYIRMGEEQDIKWMFPILQSSPEFKIDGINHYEMNELAYWLNYYADEVKKGKVSLNSGHIVLVLERRTSKRKRQIGFCIAHILSPCWCYLDVFYIFPKWRRRRYGSALLNHLCDYIDYTYNIKYISTLVENFEVGGWLSKRDFSAGSKLNYMYKDWR